MAINSLQGSKWKLYYEGPFSVIKQNESRTYSFIDSIRKIMDHKFTIKMLKPVGAKDHAVFSH
jgi:hypothetical protein